MKLSASVCAAIVAASVASPAAAQTEDNGLIDRIFVSGTAFAVKLVGGFPHATTGNECATSNGWAGLQVADPGVKAALLAAKAAGQSVTIVIAGCEASSWWKISAVYVDG